VRFILCGCNVARLCQPQPQETVMSQPLPGLRACHSKYSHVRLKRKRNILTAKA
jgi:hypothetical protein